MFQRVWQLPPGQDYSAFQMLVTSLSGGAVAAVAASPCELVMIQQQLHGGSLAGTLRRVCSRGLGSQGLFRGLLPTMARDGLYVSGLLGVTPVVQGYLVRRQGLSSSKASFVASITGGVLCSLGSHPVDIVKTCMQGDLEQRRFSTPSGTFVSLWREGGPRRIFLGALPRAINITATIYIANECVLRLSPLFFGIELD